MTIEKILKDACNKALECSKEESACLFYFLI